MNQWPQIHDDSGEQDPPADDNVYSPRGKQVPAVYTPPTYFVPIGPVQQPPIRQAYRSDPLEQPSRASPTINVYQSHYQPPPQRSAFATGFSGTFGVVAALLVIFVVLPIVVSILVMIFAAAGAATEKATKPKVEYQYRDRPTYAPP